jgi:hypothetical protein
MKKIMAYSILIFLLLNTNLFGQNNFGIKNNNSGISIVRYHGVEQTVTIPNQINGDFVTKIYLEAFNNTNVISIFIPEQVEMILLYGSAHYGENISSITVSQKNRHYSSIDGILYNKDGTVLIFCPRGKVGEVIVPNGVKIIDIDAFMACKKIIKITLPDGLEEIGCNAFMHCSNLIEINIPETVLKVGYQLEYEEGIWRHTGILYGTNLPENSVKKLEIRFPRIFSGMMGK